MNAATWFKVDPEAGQNVSGRDIFVSLVLSLILAFLLGIAVEILFLIVVAGGSSQGGPGFFLFFDIVAIVVSAGPYLGFGYRVARAGMNAGTFGYWWCLLVGVGLIGGVVLLLMLLIVAAVGPPPDPAARAEGLRMAFGISVLSAHYGVLYGVLGGTLFWRRVVRIHPDLCPPNVGARTPIRVAMFFSAFVVVAWSILFWFFLVTGTGV